MSERVSNLVDLLKRSLDKENSPPPLTESAELLNGPFIPSDGIGGAQNVVSLEKARLARLSEKDAADVTPKQALEYALADVERMGNVTKCYITLVSDTGEHWSTNNYRAGLTRPEELAFRQLAMTKLLESWRGK